MDSEGNVVEWKKRGMYCYVHNKELRDSYDTWKVIENLRKSGFKDNTGVTNEVNNNVFLAVNKKKGII